MECKSLPRAMMTRAPASRESVPWAVGVISNSCQGLGIDVITRPTSPQLLDHHQCPRHQIPRALLVAMCAGEKVLSPLLDFFWPPILNEVVPYSIRQHLGVGSLWCVRSINDSAVRGHLYAHSSPVAQPCFDVGVCARVEAKEIENILSSSGCLSMPTMVSKSEG